MADSRLETGARTLDARGDPTPATRQLRAGELLSSCVVVGVGWGGPSLAARR